MAAREYKSSERQRAAAAARYARLTPEERREERRRVRARKTPEERRAARVSEHARLKLEVLLAYGGRCACCGNDYLPHLTLDHVNGGGGEERRAAGGGRAVYRRLRRDGFPQGEYQVLCWNCNSAKHFLGVCGCQADKVEAASTS